MTSSIKTVATDGSYDIRVYTPGTFDGLAFASVDNFYSAAGVHQSATYLGASDDAVASETLQANGGYTISFDGQIHQQKTVAADGSYDIRVYTPGTFDGLAFASVDNFYSAAGVHLSATYFDASDDAIASETLQVNGGYTISFGGQIHQQKTVAADGSYDIRVYTPGTFDGLAFASVDNFYSAGVRQSATYFDASDDAIASETFQANGGYTINLGGELHQQKTVAGDGSYDIRVYTPGTFDALAFASVDNFYSAAGVRQSAVYFDAGDAAVASETFQANGGYTISLGGELHQQKSVAGDSSYDIRVYAPGTFDGLAFASVDNFYSAAGAHLSATYFDAGDDTVASVTVEANGDYTLTLGAAYLSSVTTAWLNRLAPAAVQALTATDLSAIPAAAFEGVTAAFVQNIAVAAISGLSASQIAALAPAELVRLSPAQLGGLTSQQIAGLTASEVYNFNVSFWQSHYWILNVSTWLAELPAAALPGVPPLAFQSLTEGAVSQVPQAVWQDIGTDQLNAMTASAWAGMNAPDITELPDAVVAQLSAASLASISPLAISGLSISALSAAQAGELTSAQLLNLSAEQIATLSAAQVNAISGANVAGFWSNVTADWLNALQQSALTGLTAFAFGQVSAGAIAGLNLATIQSLPATVVASLSASQLAALTTSDTRALNVADLSPTEVGELSASQISAMGNAQIADLSWDQVAAIRTSVWPALSPFFLETLPASVIPAITPTDIAAMSGAQLLDFSAGQFTAFTPFQIATITAAHPNFWQTAGFFQLDFISVDAITSVGESSLLSLGVLSSFLSPAQMAALSENEPASFWSEVSSSWFNSTTPGLTGISPTAIGELPTTTVQKLTNLAFFSAAQAAGLTAAQTEALTPTQVRNAGSAFVGALTHVSDLGLAAVSELTADQTEAISASIVPTLDSQWLSALPGADWSVLTQPQLQAILPVYIPYIDASVFASLSATQLSYLTAAQISELTPADFEAMTPGEAEDLGAADLAALTDEQLSGVSDLNTLFTASQLAASPALQTAEAATWTTAQIESVGIPNLTEAELKALSQDQLYALTPQDIEKFSETQVLEMDQAQSATIYNLLPYNAVLLADLKFVFGTPLTLSKMPGGEWYVNNYGDGTPGEALIWPDLSEQQVAALAGSNLILSNLTEAGFVSASDISSDAANTFNNLQLLPDASFAGLGNTSGSQYADTLAAAMVESDFLHKPFTLGEIDAIAPAAWDAALSDGMSYLEQAALITPAEASAAEFYFIDSASQSAWYVYNQNQQNPNWLASDPNAVTAMTDNQLAQLSAAQVQGLSTAQLVSLSVDQYQTIYGELTRPQVENVLAAEITQLPAASQANWTLIDVFGGDIQELLNPDQTSGQIFSGAFTNADQAEASNVIDFYDQNFAQIQANPGQFGELTSFYDLLETRANSEISDSAIVSQVTADIDSILNDFTLYNNALTPSATPTGGSTNVTSYVETIAASLNNTTGGLISLQSDLTGLATIENNVAQLVLDNTTEANPIPSLLEWALNGSPGANVAAGGGNLTYNNQVGLTFAQALEQVEDKLFTDANAFAKNALDGIAQVVQNKATSDELDLIENVMDVVGSVASIASGVSKLLNSFVKNFGAKAIDTTEGLIKRFADTTGFVYSGLNATEKLVKDFTTPTGNGSYSNLASAGGYIGSVVNDLTDNLTSGDATATDAITQANSFVANYQQLITTIDTDLMQGGTTLAAQFSGGESGGALSADLVNAYKQTAANGTPLFDNMTYKDVNGASHVVTLDLDDMLGAGGMTPPAGASIRTVMIGGGRDSTTISYYDFALAGPNLPGFASTQLKIEESYQPADGLGFPSGAPHITSLQLVGYNPV